MMKRLDLKRLHGCELPDDYVVIQGDFSSPDEPSASIDIQYMRLVYRTL